MKDCSTTSRLSVDFCVVGGGMAGVCAAIAAARHGAKVALVQDRSVLGGNASSEVRMHIVGADCHRGRPGARETGLIEEFRLEDAVRNPHRSYSQWDLLLYEKVAQEPNITLLLNSTCTGCTMEAAEGGYPTIRSVQVARHSTEEDFEISARFFADCTGDGRLGAEAGADYRIGREARDEFGESLALDQADTQTLGSSILFTARKYDQPQPFLTPTWIRRFHTKEFKLRPISGFEYGYWWAEWGGHLDTIRDNDKIRHELLRITMGIWDYVKNSGEYPESANWALDWVGAIPGKRESRRFLGPRILTQADIEKGRIFDDQVAYGGWLLDLHPPSGVDATREDPCVQHPVPSLYAIPLSCLYSRNVENLFFAGRNISATHVAFSSTRVMATCALMGQAVGTSAAILRDEEPSISTALTPVILRQIQQALLREDVFLPGMPGHDDTDLVQDATIRASSEGVEGSALTIRNGYTREIRDEWGTWAKAAPNCWEGTEFPAWIDLEWSEAQHIAEIHLTFCTGLERELTLSPHDRLTSFTIRGPQPETIRDYNLILDGNLLLEVRNNYLRKRKHLLPSSVKGRRLRVELLSSHGFPSPRIFEIRAYAKKGCSNV
jgi:hypothetical protein